MAERGGFEPPEGCPSSVFKTDALNRSTISPHGNVRSGEGTFRKINKILEKKKKSRLLRKKRGNKPERNLKTGARGGRIKAENDTTK